MGYSKTMTELIWAAVTAVSETWKMAEWPRVLWVIRNRVEHQRDTWPYTIKDVCRQPWQFSWWNGSSSSDLSEGEILLAGLGATQAPFQAWPRYTLRVQDVLAALDVAKAVFEAPRSMAPFPADTVFFFSPGSMEPPGSVPYWWGTDADEVTVPDSDFRWGRLRA